MVSYLINLFKHKVITEPVG